jgi:hypothetical protein
MVTRGDLDLAVYSRTARLAFRACFSKIKNQKFEIKNHTVG